MKLAQLKSFGDACKVEGLNAKKVVPSFAGLPFKDRKSMKAHTMLVIIVRAANRIANGGKQWTPDFDNVAQDKWEIWWIKRGSSGFRYYVYDFCFRFRSSALAFASLTALQLNM